jgi:hypothetical protein
MMIHPLLISPYTIATSTNVEASYSDCRRHDGKVLKNHGGKG